MSSAKQQQQAKMCNKLYYVLRRLLFELHITNSYSKGIFNIMRVPQESSNIRPEIDKIRLDKPTI